MLTADGIRADLTSAFDADHGAGCSCCQPFAGGLSPLQRALESEARMALGRYDRDAGHAELDDAPSESELEELVRLAAGDALVAARQAITARAVATLVRGQSAVDRPSPVILAIDPATHRPSCRAETFDGTYHRQCTRPASFLRDGLEVCRQHVALPSTRAYDTSS